MSTDQACHSTRAQGGDIVSVGDRGSRTDKEENRDLESSRRECKVGIEVLSWDGPHDRTNPINWSNRRKWLVTGTALLGTLVCNLNGTSITVASDQINEQFGVSDANFPNSYWAVTSWSLGGALFIIFVLPIFEDLGVRISYVVTYVFFLIMLVPQAVAQNYATLIVTRFFSGGCVALLANTISSIIPDLWETDAQRSVPVGLYIVNYVGGSSLGPVVFAPVMQFLNNWRWIFYIQIIVYGALAPFFFLVLKETRGHVILRRKAKTIRQATGRQVFSRAELSNIPLSFRLYKAATRPLYLLVTEPVLFAATLWSAFSYGTVYTFTQSTAQVFTALYGWEEYQAGYVQGAIVVGELIGWVMSLYGTHLFLRSARRNPERPGKPIPEARLYVSVFASFFGLAGGMFVYAWTSYTSFPWIAPAIGLAMVGAGIQVIVTAVADYIVDAYAASDYTGSAISAVAAGENVVAGLVPLAAQSMYSTLGFQWASSLLGFIALLLSLAPVVFVWKGRWFREKSPFMQGGFVQTKDAPSS